MRTKSGTKIQKKNEKCNTRVQKFTNCFQKRQDFYELFPKTAKNLRIVSCFRNKEATRWRLLWVCQGSVMRMSYLFRALAKSCPVKIYRGAAKGLTSRAFSASVWKRRCRYPAASSAMMFRHAFALFLALTIASLRFFSQTSAGKFSVPKNEVSVADSVIRFSCASISPFVG